MSAMFIKCSCGARLSVGENAGGKRFRCPRCSAINFVPEIEDAVLAEEANDTNTAGLSRSDPFPAHLMTQTQHSTNMSPSAEPPQQPAQPPTAPVRSLALFFLAIGLVIAFLVYWNASDKEYCWFWQSECWNAETRRPNAPSTGTSRSRPPAKPSAPIAKPDPPGTFGSGTKMVNREIEPGTYRTRSSSVGCYWARLAGLSGDLSEIVANDNTNGPAIVTIVKTDQAFHSTSCSRWTKDLSPITSSQTAPFGSGTYLVGVDIAPGTWRADTAESCYWARLRNFSGGLGGVLANNNGVGLVTIRASDKGFTSSLCGAWTRVR